MSGPNTFSMLVAISGVNAILPCSRSESSLRRTFKRLAAFVKLRLRASMTSVLIKSPGWGGFFGEYALHNTGKKSASIPI
jgi:hypothetical protein